MRSISILAIGIAIYVVLLAINQIRFRFFAKQFPVLIVFVLGWALFCIGSYGYAVKYQGYTPNMQAYLHIVLFLIPALLCWFVDAKIKKQ